MSENSEEQGGEDRSYTDDEFIAALADFARAEQETSNYKQLTARHLGGLAYTALEHGLMLTNYGYQAFSQLAGSLATAELYGAADRPAQLKSILLGCIVHGYSQGIVEVFMSYSGAEPLTENDSEAIEQARIAAEERATRLQALSYEIGGHMVVSSITDEEVADRRYDAFLRYLENALYEFRYSHNDSTTAIRRSNLTETLRELAKMLRMEDKIMPIVNSLLSVDPYN